MARIYTRLEQCRRGHGPELYRRDKTGTPKCRGCHRLFHPLKPTISRNERFEAAIDRSAGPDGCWPWMRTRVASGYGRFRWDGKTWWAHRLSFYLANGYLPEAVCHRCDNPPCQNPRHLRAGTLADNTLEMWAKGRARGNASGKLSPAQVAFIDSHPYAHPQALASRFGVSKRTIYRLRSATRPKMYRQLPVAA